jgi:hypothetical protein
MSSCHPSSNRLQGLTTSQEPEGRTSCVFPLSHLRQGWSINRPSGEAARGARSRSASSRCIAPACATRLHARKGDWPLAHKLPLIGGHEGVGHIVAIGAHTIESPVEIGELGSRASGLLSAVRAVPQGLGTKLQTSYPAFMIRIANA